MITLHLPGTKVMAGNLRTGDVARLYVMRAAGSKDAGSVKGLGLVCVSSRGEEDSQTRPRL